MLSEEWFTNVEEIGLRLKALRLSRNQSIAQIRGRNMTHICYQKAEDAKGSWTTLQKVASLLGASVEVCVNGAITQNIQQAIMDYCLHKNMNIAEMAETVGVPYTSVKVFVNAQRPQVHSIGRYVRMLRVPVKIRVMYRNKPVVPTQILPKDAIRQLQDVLDSVLFDDKTTVNTSLGKELMTVRLEQGFSKAAVSCGAGITHASVSQVERNQALLSTAAKVAEVLGKTIIVHIGDRIVGMHDVPKVLDLERQNREIPIATFARALKTTYRTVEIFPDSEPSLKNLQRYADGLGVKLSYQLV
jgi:predicted XRE-type DNA-binding protein/DNA-binding XRE family transcriptional regulator